MYTAHRVDTPILLDGSLTDPAWKLAPKSPSFTDMATGRAVTYDTYSAVLWDDTYLYVGFWAEEPYPNAELTERDSIIFQENDIELFIDGGDSYYELEINALGTIYEVFFIWRDAYRRGGRFDIPEFDPIDRNAYSFAGDFDRTPAHFWRGTHPRGPRWAFLDWDFPGLRTAVRVDGELNDETHRSRGWTVEMALPWQGMAHLANGRALPPKDGDIWKLFFGRFQNLPVADRKVQAAWCWSPHGLYDTHMPEKFTPIQFSTKTASP